MDEDEWESTYGLSPLLYGISLEQGMRETMEDAAQVVPHGRYGFFFASECGSASYDVCCALVAAANSSRLTT